MLKKRCSILACCLLALLPVVAQQPDQRGIGINTGSASVKGNTYAIVVGISQYKEVPSLRFADRDAAVFADYLLSKTGMGLDSANVYLFQNEKANLANIGNAISDIILKKLKKGDKVIFFFAGHGDYDANFMKNQALLLLYGSPKENYFQNVFGADFISTAQLNDHFIEPIISREAQVLLIVDACHANGVDKKLSGGAEGGRITAQALQNMNSSVKLYSCQANQLSLESEQWGGGRGLFSYVLMEGLYGLADVDSNKIVTLRELQRYLEDRVPVLAKPNKQDPIIKMEDATEVISKVNDSFLMTFLANRDKSISFLTTASIKGSDEFLTRGMDSAQLRLYAECNSLIEQKQCDKAYEKFRLLNDTDSTGDAVTQLRRNLSAAYQEKAARILLPMQEDVYNFVCTPSDLLQAQSEMNKAAELLGPQHFLYQNLKGRILFMKALSIKISRDTSRNKEAINYLQESLKLDPNAPYTYYYLGYFNRNINAEQARINYEKYLTLIPNSCWANNSLGYVNIELKNYEEARKYISKAIELKPDYHNAWNNMGNLYYKQQKFSEAVKYYRKAVELKSDYLIAWNNMGNACQEAGLFDSAAICFKKVLELKPGSRNAYYALMQVYSHLGNTDSALFYLEPLLKDKKINLNEINDDAELNKLRQKKSFKELLRKYFSKDDLKQYPDLFSAGDE
jgi:tetratricopeptide (TPR) repeat protein